MEELNLNQLEVGEWYEVKPSSGWKGWLHKHVKIINGNQANGTIITTRLWSNRCEDYTWCSGYTFRKATKEQLKSFLPKDHPDYPIENSDYKWMLMLEDKLQSNTYKKGTIVEIYKWRSYSVEYKMGFSNNTCFIKENKIKPFLTKEEAEKYWDKLNQSKPVEKPIETPKTKQLSDLKKGDWVKLILNISSSNFTTNNLYKLVRDWDDGYGLFYDNRGELNGFGSASNLRNFTVPTQQEIETWEKSLIKNEPKEFVLPEKWYFELKPEFAQAVCDYVIQKHPTYTNWFPKAILNNKYISNKHPCLTSSNDKYGTLITFEQFEKYVLKSKMTVEDKPKEDMKYIPKYWYIENKYQEVRDYLADVYDKAYVKHWNYSYIGFNNAKSHNGCQGCTNKQDMQNGAIEITIEQFREYFLKKPKEIPQDDNSWWYELEAGDVIESLSEIGSLRNVGDKFIIIKVEKQRVYYQEHTFSDNATTWKLISKAKDEGRESSTHRIETTITTSPNWYETSINDKPITQFCPQPEETEIVPISKYFKIRN